ncbi:hypothetical protein [Hymenobacter glacialis]|uniref:G-D-S-L family lipolytic protein n=1 Tax=Hymenobacter glacialis TaxID=1908236 RepID=A0A1G1SUR1_9BACT|nr:hypothetical protein [Hymenobacter glacialis]OGX82353.1 hypothetical protein BEN48_05250 [Hymenobacter glacialis]
MNTFYFTQLGRTGLVAVATAVLNACAPGQDTPTPTTSVDVTRYVAVGDSYTAGVSAGGLTRASQEYSFPNLLARQFQGASREAVFTQPLLEAGTGSGFIELVDFPATGLPKTRRVAGQAVRRTIINPGTCAGPDTVRVLTRNNPSSTLPQNLGIPGLALSQIETAGLGNEGSAVARAPFNPYFERLLPPATTRTYLQAVTDVAASATFFTYFQGLDDLLPYVQSGGQCGGRYDSTAFRNQALLTMRTNARKVLDRLAAGGRPGIIAKLPALTTLPLLRLGNGTALLERFSAAPGVFITVGNPFRPAQVRPITSRDYVLAPLLSRVGQPTAVVVGGATLMLPYGLDSRNPLRDADVLDESELTFVSFVLNGYNNELETLARDVYKMPVITPDGNQRALNLDVVLFDQVAGLISVGGVVYSPELVRGNFFSLDYYTLTPRGNGLLANAFITAINKAYRANIPAVDVNSLPTVAQ